MHNPFQWNFSLITTQFDSSIIVKFIFVTINLITQFLHLYNRRRGYCMYYYNYIN